MDYSKNSHAPANLHQKRNIDKYWTLVDEQMDDKSASDTHFHVRKSRHIVLRAKRQSDQPVVETRRDVADVQLEDKTGVPYQDAEDMKGAKKKKNGKRVS